MGELKIQYLTNEKGEKTAALVDIHDWREIMRVFQEHELAKSLRAGFAEVEAIKAGEVEALTLEDLFDEL